MFSNKIVIASICTAVHPGDSSAGGNIEKSYDSAHVDEKRLFDAVA